MKKSIGVITLRSGMAVFYGQLLTRLFGDIADIYVYNMEEKTIQSLRACDLYLNASTSYDLMRNDWAKAYLPLHTRWSIPISRLPDRLSIF